VCPLYESPTAELREVPPHGCMANPELLAELPHGRAVVLLNKRYNPLPPLYVQHISAPRRILRPGLPVSHREARTPVHYRYRVGSVSRHS
jgi:hypothetical protein